MKKQIAKMLTALCLVLSLALCAGCTLIFPQPDDSFPHEVAQSRGEYSTDGGWLAAADAPATELRRAYLEAVDDGSFSGTYVDFLERIGVTGGQAQYALRSVVSVYTDSSIGSGVIYSLDRTTGDAYIVTNYHVVYDPEVRGHISGGIEVYLYGQEYEVSGIAASYVGGAMEYDLAVLKVTGCNALRGTTSYAQAVPADSDALAAGDRVYAVGNADAGGISMTAGVISVDAEYIAITGADGTTALTLLEIRSDVAVNHGNSGGGLFNDMGEIVGIVNARAEGEEEFIDGFGYAIPINLAFAVAQNIIDTCTTSPLARCAAVARFADVSAIMGSAVFDETTGRFYLEEKVIVSRLEVNMPAERAGLRRGDTLITAKLIPARGSAITVDITRTFKIENLLPLIRLGDTLELTVSRDNAVQTIRIAYTSNSDFRMVA